MIISQENIYALRVDYYINMREIDRVIATF